MYKCREGQCASSCQISWQSAKPLLRYDDFSSFPIWRLSAILDLLCACLDHPRTWRRAFGGLYQCAKFGWNQWSSFDNMQVLVFARKNACSRPQNVLGMWTPKWAVVSTEPKEAYPCAIPHHYETSCVKIRGPAVWPVGKFPKKGV